MARKPAYNKPGRPLRPGIDFEDMPGVISDPRPIPDMPGSGDSVSDQPISSNRSVRVATPDIILFSSEAVTEEEMTELVFEAIGGQELLLATRNDVVNGQNVIYQPIKNLAEVGIRYNPNNIIALQNPSYVYFDRFIINLDDKIPSTGNVVYLDTNGNLVIEVDNMNFDEQVEVQIMNSVNVLDDTIYDGGNS